MSRARRSPALRAILAGVAPASAPRPEGSFTSSEDRILATDKAKQEATETLHLWANRLIHAEHLHETVGSETTRLMVEGYRQKVIEVNVVFNAAWDAAFEALEAHDGEARVSAA